MAASSSVHWWPKGSPATARTGSPSRSPRAWCRTRDREFFRYTDDCVRAALVTRNEPRISGRSAARTWLAVFAELPVRRLHDISPSAASGRSSTKSMSTSSERPKPPTGSSVELTERPPVSLLRTAVGAAALRRGDQVGGLARERAEKHGIVLAAASAAHWRPGRRARWHLDARERAPRLLVRAHCRRSPSGAGGRRCAGCRPGSWHRRGRFLARQRRLFAVTGRPWG